MTEAQLARTVARQTGESLRTVHHLGFQPSTNAPPALEDIRLVVNCPSCRRPVPYPGRDRDGSLSLAVCADSRCDHLFDYDPARVYAV